MASWPGNPVAQMAVDSFGGGTSSSVWFDLNVSNSQTVLDINIEWTIGIVFDDHPWIDNGRGFFRATLYRLNDNGNWDQIDYTDRSLGNNDDDGHWSDTLTLRGTMAREIEVYKIDLHCETRDTTMGTDASHSRQFTAIQGSQVVGNFTLDYQPVSIVYCPPNQDMTASLTQSLSYGTRMTIGTTEGFEAQTTASVDVTALGVKMGGVSTTDSHSMSNSSQAGIELSYFRNTVLTADNQRALGRAYWGPLGDIFVIAVNPRYATSRRADGKLFYNPTSMDQLIVVPAYKLLRPGDDPVISALPEDVRRRTLELDPFIQNLDLFFPDSGAELSVAANPYADPSRDNRAEPLGRWWINNGCELNYSIGEAKELKSGEATEIKYSSTVTTEAGFGFNLFGIIGVGAHVGNSFTTTLALQSSRETIARTSKTAACYLIRNQNERDLDGIQIYYDKIFSTLMFRKIRARRRIIVGTVADLAGAKVAAVAVKVTGRDDHDGHDGRGKEHVTTTDASGTFTLYELEPGNYTLQVGDQTRELVVPDDEPEQRPTSTLRLDIRGVRRVIDLGTSPAWEVGSALRIDSDAIWRLTHYRDKVFDLADLAHLAGKDTGTLGAAAQNVSLTWPRTPLEQLKEISPAQAALLRERAGIDSLQALWTAAKTPRGLEEVSANTNIPIDQLRRWVDLADAGRVSRTKEGTPPKPPRRCIDWLCRHWPFRYFCRPGRFRRSRRAAMLLPPQGTKT